MGEQTDIASFSDRWGRWVSLLGVAISLAALLGFGSFFYNRIWASRVLAYAVLPTYELPDQAFSGIVVENRGRVPLTDVQVVLADLELPIQALNMPGAHEPASISTGGVGVTEALIEIPRLSEGASISIYLLTSEVVRLEEGITLFISSRETVGVAATTAEQTDMLFVRILAGVLLVVGLASIATAVWLTRSSETRITQLKNYAERIERELESLRRELPGSSDQET